MRKSYFFFLIIGILVSIFAVSTGVTHAGTTCGINWPGAHCSDSPYDCKWPDCGIEWWQKAVKEAIKWQITEKGIVEYSKDIIKYLMGFVSLIALIYILYAGFQLMIGAGDEEKMKKTRSIITYVILWIIIMWLAWPIVNWTVGLLGYNGSIIPRAVAYTESDSDTFAEYKNKIKEAVSQMESELILNKSVSATTIQNVKNLVQGGFDRLPDYGDAATTNREAKQVVDTYLGLALQNPTNSNHVGNAISRVSGFVDRVNIWRITGDINAGPAEGNAPLSVSFRATDIKDPSGTTPSDNNYIWWTRENGGNRRELSRGPSLSYTFTKEGTYTVFLDVISGNKNSKWKTDVLPLSVSKQITVKPKLGEIILLINGVNASNMDKIKISPTIGKMGVILDASASRAIGNGTIAETKWEFGNGESSVNKWGPIVERQIYANQWGYILKLTMKTNDGQVFTKEIQLLVMDPSATIKLDKNTGHIGEEISMSAISYFSDTKNVEYSWQVQDENGNKVVKVGQWANFKHKFDSVGSYIVSLASKSPNGGVDSDSKVITIESREPVVSIDSPRALRSDKPNTIVFDASKSYDPDSNSKKNLSYIWKIDGEKVTLDNVENNGAKWTYTFDSKGSHRVSVSVSNVYGKIAVAESQFDVTSTLSVNIISTPKVVKRGEPITLIGQSGNAEIFEWNMGDGTPAINGTSRSTSHIFKQSGTYDVRLTVSRDNGTETNSISRKVYVTDADSPFAIIEASNSSNSIITESQACNGNDALIINRADTTTFTANNSVNVDGTANGLSYTWKYFGKARTTPSISEKFNELGCFPIELTVRSNKNGATHTTIQYVKLTNQLPEITSLTTTIDSAKKDSQKILVKVKANGATDPDGVITSYIWYFKTESDPEPQNVQITQKDEITFVLPNITEKYYFGVILEDNDGARMNSAESGNSPTPLVIDNSNGNIHLPLITLTTPKTVVNVGEQTRFSVEVKTIIPGVNITNKAEYAWDFDGDGRIDEKSTVPTIEHVYPRSGDYNMKVRVTNNGVSNSKYQTIHVKNKLQASVYGYRLPDNRVYLINTSEGSYNKAVWELGLTNSESLNSVMLSANEVPTTGKITVSSDDSEVSTANIDFSNLEVIAGTGVLFQSFPKSINDTITIKNPGDSIYLSMYGNKATNYTIDTDTSIDTNLDGLSDNDIDNRDDSSYTEWSPFTIRNLWDTNKRERQIRITTVENGIPVATKTLTVILDYIAGTSENTIDLSGSGVTGLSTGDRAKLEELSKMIRELTDSDRIILMQRYNVLVENWNNPFDKAKSLIDIQEGIESANIDSDRKTKMSQIVDELLIGDATVTDEVGIAALLIRDLIPKESPNHDTLLAKLAEIESHPTLLEENKKLWKEMLLLIEKDTTIPDKYKGHIKNQLLVIINGWSNSIPETNTGATETKNTETTDNGILGFIGGFVKVFFIIIGVILVIGIIGFIFYRITRKGDNIGFQDFLIDSIFHNKPTPSTTEIDIKPDTIVNGAPPLPKEDPLTSYTPVVQPITQEVIQPPPAYVPTSDPLSISTPTVTTPEPTPVVKEENIPSWLKVPSNNTPDPIEAVSNNTESITEEPVYPATEDPLMAMNTSEIHTENNIEESTTLQEAETPVYTPIDPLNSIPMTDTTLSSDDSIPDWIKNTQSNTAEEIIETPIAEKSNVDAIGENTDIGLVTERVSPDDDKLPDWLISSLKNDVTPPVVEEPVVEKTDNTAEEIIEAPAAPIQPMIGGINLLELSEEKEKEKKPKKKPKVTIAKKIDKKEEIDPTTPDTDNLPDWLK